MLRSGISRNAAPKPKVQQIGGTASFPAIALPVTEGSDPGRAIRGRRVPDGRLVAGSQLVEGVSLDAGSRARDRLEETLSQRCASSRNRRSPPFVRSDQVGDDPPEAGRAPRVSCARRLTASEVPVGRKNLIRAVKQQSDTHGVSQPRIRLPVSGLPALDVAPKEPCKAFAGPSSGEDATDCNSPRNQETVRCRCRRPNIGRWSRHSLRMVRTHRSAMALAWVPVPGFGPVGFPETRAVDRIRRRNSDRSWIKKLGGSVAGLQASTTCWASQHAFGCAVTRACTICRVPW